MSPFDTSPPHRLDERTGVRLRHRRANRATARLAAAFAVMVAVCPVTATGDDSASSPRSPAALMALESSLLDNPVIAAIKRREPDTYTALWSTMLDGTARGLKQRELRAAIEPYISRTVGKYLVLAEDDALLEMVNVIVAEIRVFEPYPADCYALINQNGAPVPADTARLPPALADSEREAGARVIESGATNPQRMPRAAEVDPLLGDIFNRLTARIGIDDVRVIGRLNDPTVDKARLCYVTRALYEQILAAPRAQSVPMLRAMMAGAR
jgi:hypothetical protein